MFNKLLKVLVPVVVLVSLIGFIGHNYINYVEKKREPVAVPKKTDKVMFFYRDDCSDCQSIFHQIYWKNFISRDVEFINMNESSNRKYIEEYNLVSVPTFVHDNKQYAGTNISDIDDVMGD